MKKLFTLLLSVSMIVTANAADINAAASGNWSDAATWTGGVVPGAGDNVNAGAFVITVTADAACNNYSIVNTALAGSLTLNEGVTLTVNGVMDVAGATAALDVDLLSLSALSSTLKLTGTGVVGEGTFAAPVFMITDFMVKSIRPKNLVIETTDARTYKIGNTQGNTFNVSAGKFTLKSPSNVFLGSRMNIGKVDGVNELMIESGATLYTKIIEGSFDGKKIPAAKVVINGTLTTTDRSTIRNIYMGETGLFKVVSGNTAIADYLKFDGWWNQTASSVAPFSSVNEYSTPAFMSLGANTTIEYNRTSAQHVQGTIPENKVWYIGSTPPSFLQKVGGGDSVILSYNIPYANIKLSGAATKTIQSNLVAKGNVTIDLGATFVLPAGKVLVIGGVIDGAGTFTNSGAVINLTSADVTKGTVTARVNAANEVSLVAMPKPGFQLLNYTEGGSPLASATFTPVDGAPRNIIANWTVSTGLNDLKADSYITIAGKTLNLHGDITAVEVYDTMGRRILAQQNATNVNLKSNGIYIVKMHTAQGVNVQKVNIK